MSSMNENDLWLNGVEVRDSCGRLTVRAAIKGATGAGFNQTNTRYLDSVGSCFFKLSIYEMASVFKNSR